MAQYLLDREDGEHWQEWLRTQRVELNAMTTPAFIAWLDGKMAEHEGEKVQPPEAVLVAEMQRRTEHHLRRGITDRVLREAGIDAQVADAFEAIPKVAGAQLAIEVAEWLPEHEDALWRTYVDERAKVAAEAAPPR